MLSRNDFIKCLSCLLEILEENNRHLTKDEILEKIDTVIQIERFDLSGVMEIKSGIEKYTSIISKSSEKDLPAVVDCFIDWIPYAIKLIEFVENNDIESAFENLINLSGKKPEVDIATKKTALKLLVMMAQKVNYDFSDVSDDLLIAYIEKYKFQATEELAIKVSEELRARLDEFFAESEYHSLQEVYKTYKKTYADGQDLSGIKRLRVLYFPSQTIMLDVYNFFIATFVNIFHQQEHLEMYRRTYFLNTSTDFIQVNAR